MTNNNLRVEQREKTVVMPYDALIVNHMGKDVEFATPIIGPCTYATAVGSLRDQELDQPTMAQTASLVHAGFQGTEGYSNQIRRTMKKNWFWGFTGNRWVKDEGVYIQDNPEIVGAKASMDRKDLVKTLESGDTSVRFVPFGFKTGKQSALELAKNPYVIGLAGEEGADKLAQVADKHRNKPYLYAFKNVDNDITRVSALYSGWVGDRLYVNGDSCGGYSDGYAFGVLNKSSEAGAKKSEK